MKIGITERGDAAIDFSWIEKMNSVDGAILITKNIASEQFQTAVATNIFNGKNNAIIHATITGYGGTDLEPNVPKPEITIAALNSFAAQYSRGHFVLRVDPIIPTNEGTAVAMDIIRAVNIKRVRISFIDQYAHVRDRFNTRMIVPLPWNTFHAPEMWRLKSLMSLSTSFPDRLFEMCGEEPLNLVSPLENVTQLGCVSTKDAELMGLPMFHSLSAGYQRANCRCLSCKTELLSNKQQCPHGCVYCYWR